MPLTHEPTGRGPYASTNPKAWKNVTAEDIPPGWIDNMVKRIFDELNRQLIRVENTSKQLSDKKDARGQFEDDPKRRASDANTLASLIRSMEKAIELEMGRSENRAIKAVRKPKDVRKALAQQIAAVIEHTGPKRLPAPSK